MRFARKTALTIAFVLSSAPAFSLLRAAESAPSPAPEKIEFSRSTSPKIPRPGVKTEDRFTSIGNIPEGRAGGTDVSVPIAPPATTTFPSKAAAEKLLQDWDRKKNWAFSKEEEKESDDPLAKIERENEDELTGPSKPKGAMEEFLAGESKKRTSTQSRLSDLDRDTDRRDNRLSDPRDRRDRRSDRDDRDDRDGDRDRDPNDNRESNGLAEFNLKNFIRQQNGMQPFIKDNPLPRASQMFRSGIGPGDADPRTVEKDRAAREARSAEFMQMLKPRTTVGSFATGVNDPINSPDLSRREANPILPNRLQSSTESSRSPFSSPTPPPTARIQENAMFGVTGPAASSITPSVSAPAPRPVDATRAHQIIIEAPRRIGF